MVTIFPSCTNKNNKGDDNLLSLESSIPHPSDNYSKEKNIEYFNDNYDLINEIISEMEQYNFYLVFFNEDEFYCKSDSESNDTLVMKNKELVDNVKKLLDDRIISFVGKDTSETDKYEYTLGLAVEKKGYSCFFIKLNDEVADETLLFHIKNNWYYTEGLNV